MFSLFLKIAVIVIDRLYDIVLLLLHGITAGDLAFQPVKRDSYLIALVGLYFLCITESLTFNIGDLYLLLGATCFATQIILIDHFVQKGGALVLSLVSQCAVALFSAIFAVTTEVISFSAIKAAWLPICFIVFLAGAVAQTIQTVYQKDLEPGLASLLMSFESVFAAIFGWLLLKQTLTLKEIFGCVLVMIAIIIAD